MTTEYPSQGGAKKARNLIRQRLVVVEEQKLARAYELVNDWNLNDFKLDLLNNLTQHIINNPLTSWYQEQLMRHLSHVFELLDFTDLILTDHFQKAKWMNDQLQDPHLRQFKGPFKNF